MREYTPFTPGQRVPLDLFVGRTDTIDKIMDYIRRPPAGGQEHIFLSGERGIGKTSLAQYLTGPVQREANLLPVHVNVGGVTALEEMLRHLFEEVLNVANARPWYDKVRGLFGKYIDQLDVFGVKLAFNPPRESLEHLVSHFHEAIHNILESMRDETEGLFIVLDDINGLATNERFANWYKSFAESASMRYERFPVVFVLVGLPEIRSILNEQQPSLMRIFRVAEVPTLSDAEVEGFFEKAFAKVESGVEPEAMKRMVSLSGGLPILMQEIGDAIYRIDNDRVISEDDALAGCNEAAVAIGEKHLEQRVYRAIQSEGYMSILRKMGRKGSIWFRKRDMLLELDDSEKRVFDNFLTKMKRLGVIMPFREMGSACYKFANPLYMLYVMLESRGALPRKGRKRPNNR